MIRHKNGAVNIETTFRPAAELPGPRSAVMGRSSDYAPATPSVVSLSAIVAAAAAAAALSLILLVPGTGLGFLWVSPWASAGVSAATIGIAAIMWVTVTQILASGMGGYVAGRLRTQ